MGGEARHHRVRTAGWTLVVTIVVALVTWGLSGLASYSGNDTTMKERLTAAETEIVELKKQIQSQADKLDHRMERMEDRLNQIWDRVK